MAGSHETRAAEKREKANEYDAVADALEALREEVMEADRIGDTQLSKLFHEARTNRPDAWKSATAFIDIEDGEAVVDSVSKLRDGRWSPETRNRHDALVTVGVRPFMGTSEFKAAVRDDLEQRIRGARANANSAREAANVIEHRAGCNA